MRQGSETQRLCSKQFQSTHPLRGATKAKHGQQDSCHISIHAPLAGCDLCRRFNASCIGYFNPRTPCGVRPFSAATVSPPSAFQSTHPLRGATIPRSQGGLGVEQFQSTHPLRGATDFPDGPVLLLLISIHAPLAGCDTRTFTQSTRTNSFQSTHPLRGATTPFCA